MKRIITIFLIIIIISCIVLPFAVSADDYQLPYNDYKYFLLDTNLNTISKFGTTVYSLDTPINAIGLYYNNILQIYSVKTIVLNSVAIETSMNGNYSFRIFTTSTNGPGVRISYNNGTWKSQLWIGTGNSDYCVLCSNYGYCGYNENGYFSGFALDDELNFTFTYNNNSYYINIYGNNPLYSINFNSNGGSTIEPITDIEPGSTVNLDITVGGINTYNPAYVPERDGYLFDYWYQIDYPLTPVHSITVNDDTTLIAKWSNDPALAHITFGNGFYSDVNHSAALTSGYYEIGSYIDFYTYYSGSQIYRGKVAFTDLNDDVTYYQGPSGSYRYHVQITESGSFSLVLLDYCTTYVSLYPNVEGTYVSHIQYAIQDGEWHNYTFDDSLTIQPGYQLHFRFYLTAPYVITEGVYYYSLTDYENVFIRSDVKTNNDWQTFWTEVYLDFTVNHSGTLYLYVKSISDFDITSRDIVGIYDESTGEFSWTVSEVSLLDTNWEDVASNIPQNLAYMFDGIYSLSGLAIIVPLCMMVAFGLWFIRRS